MTTTDVRSGPGRLTATRYVSALFAVVALVALGGLFALVGGLTDPTDIHAMHGFGWAGIAGLAVGGSMVALAVRPALDAPLLAVIATGVLIVVAAVAAGAFDPFILVFVVMGLVIWAVRGRFVSSPLAMRSKPLVAAAVVSLVAGASYAIDQVSLQTGAGTGDEHAAEGHYVGQAVLVLLIPLLLAVASTRLSGWRAVGWFAAGVAFLLALGSLVTDQVGQLSTGAAVGVLAGALAIAGLVEWVARGDRTASA